jgi:hypothetical protein
VWAVCAGEAERGPRRPCGGGKGAGLGRARGPVASGLGLRLALAALGATWALAAGGEARAEGGPAADRAEALFREGREAMKRGDLGEACPKFAESQELDPSPGTLLNLALCEQRKGEGTRAWTHYQELVATLPPGDERAAIARSRAEALSQRLPRLAVQLGAGSPPGARVWLDGVELDAAKLGVSFLVDPGAHTIVVQAPGRVERRYPVQAESGRASSLTVVPSPVPTPDSLAALQGGAPAGPTPAADAPPRRRSKPESLSFEQRSGYTLLALGGVSIAVGALSGFFAIEQARSSERHCINEVCDPIGRRTRETARTFTLISALTAGGGLVIGTVGGVILWQSSSKSQSSAISPVVTQRGGGVAWRLDF